MQLVRRVFDALEVIAKRFRDGLFDGARFLCHALFGNDRAENPSL